MIRVNQFKGNLSVLICSTILASSLPAIAGTAAISPNTAPDRILTVSVPSEASMRTRGDIAGVPLLTDCSETRFTSRRTASGDLQAATKNVSQHGETAVLSLTAIGEDSPDTTASITSEESQLADLLNADRSREGLAPVVIDPLLCKIAREHSQDMFERKYFDHYAPGSGPSSPTERYVAALGHRPAYAMVGENIYYRSMTDVPTETATQAEKAFINSPGHRANIMQPKFNRVGIGFYRANGRFWVTQLFLGDNA